jgi:protein ImuB
VSASVLSIPSEVLPGPAAKQIERAKETERILSILHQWGIHTLGQLAALPRDDLAARLGARAVELWDRANGRAERILKLVSPPESFIESFEFENEIETIEPLLFILRRFLQQLATRLNAIYLVAKTLRLRLTFADSPQDEFAGANKSDYERIFKIPQPTNNEDILFRMLHTHLENFTSKHPIVAVELEAQPSRSVRQQFGLFETALRDPMQLHETLARLVGLLGAERVGTPVLEKTHRPDAFRMKPFVWEFCPSPSATGHPERQSRDPDEVTLKLRRDPPANAQDEREKAAAKEIIPLRRFRKRITATVLLESNRPAHVRSAGRAGLAVRAGAAVEGATVMQDGPYPLSGNWWDEQAWARVEWDVEIENGILARCYCDQGGWAIDGIYD